MTDEIISQKQFIARLENHLSMQKLKKRKAATRRKIEYGGLVIKAGMGDYSKDVILGALTYVKKLIANDTDYLKIFEGEGQRMFIS